MSEQPKSTDPRHGVDPLIVDAVDHIRNRFGASGLRQLIAVATDELAATDAALKELHEAEVTER